MIDKTNWPTTREEYIEGFNAWVKEHNIVKGSYVKVLCRAETHQNGWHDMWDDKYMSKMIGGIYPIEKVVIDDGYGNRLYEISICFPKHAYDFYFPYFVLEPIDDTDIEFEESD